MIGTSRPVTASIDHLNSYIDRNGLAAVAVRTGVNFTYLAGMAPCAKNLPLLDTFANWQSVGGKRDRPQPLLSARTPGKRCTSLMKFASRGEVLSLRHTRDSARGVSKSTTGKMTIVSGDRQRAVPMTHPTPKPVATRLRIVASFSPS